MPAAILHNIKTTRSQTRSDDQCTLHKAITKPTTSTKTTTVKAPLTPEILSFVAQALERQLFHRSNVSNLNIPEIQVFELDQ